MLSCQSAESAAASKASLGHSENLRGEGLRDWECAGLGCGTVQGVEQCDASASRFGCDARRNSLESIAKHSRGAVRVASTPTITILWPCFSRY